MEKFDLRNCVAGDIIVMSDGDLWMVLQKLPHVLACVSLETTARGRTLSHTPDPDPDVFMVIPSDKSVSPDFQRRMLFLAGQMFALKALDRRQALECCQELAGVRFTTDASVGKRLGPGFTAFYLTTKGPRCGSMLFVEGGRKEALEVVNAKNAKSGHSVWILSDREGKPL